MEKRTEAGNNYLARKRRNNSKEDRDDIKSYLHKGIKTIHRGHFGVLREKSTMKE